jgi:hypothetical protein
MPGPASPAPAFKEWAVVVRALLSGEQILDVRKGGLREDERRFDLRATRFWLYPTTEHQRVDLVKPAYRRWVEEPREPRAAASPIVFEGWADVAAVARITEPEELAKLDSKLVWTSDYTESRLRWKRREPLMVLALRTYRLDEPLVAPWRDEYAGCSSWVQLDGGPPDPGELASEPALTDESFAARLELVSRELPGAFAPPE